MPITTVRGVAINYEVLGDRGPWVALQPGGRRGLVGVRPLGQKIAEAGNRVLVYDRRNCGASDISFDGEHSENEMWDADLHELLRRLDATPAFIGGSSSGCRLALLAALRHPAGTPVVAGHRRWLCRRAPGAELLHSVYRSRAKGWHGSGLSHRAFR
jgi:pimeloyl-ACP methyl ester carboxylesterase